LHNALHALGIDQIAVPAKPLDLHPSQWEALPASEAAEQEAQHNSLARIHRNGYVCAAPSGSDQVVTVLRKAIVVLYRFEPVRNLHEPETSEVSSTHDNQTPHDSSL
jgi:hypothetical protein